MMKGASKSGALLYSRDKSRKRLPQRTQRKTKDQNPPPLRRTSGQGTARRHSAAEPQPKSKTHHGGTETRRKTGETQLHRGDAEKNLISMKNLRGERRNLG